MVFPSIFWHNIFPDPELDKGVRPVPTHFIIRPATGRDYEAVTNLLNASYATLMATAYSPQILSQALPIISKANPKLLASGTYYVAETDTQSMVGCGGWTKERPGSGDVAQDIGHIRHFATHPRWTGKGIGRALFNASEAAACSAGIRHLECYASLNAQGFYEALGFKAIAQAKVELAPGIELAHVHMKRAL